MLFNGADANENITLSANGSRSRLIRDVGNVTMDVNGVEQINVNALGGADTITVNDLTGTDVTACQPESRSDGRRPGGHRHRQWHADDDDVFVSGDSTGVSAIGLAAQVNITGAEAAKDRLTSTHSPATTWWMLQAWRPARSSSRPTAAMATTS